MRRPELYPETYHVLIGGEPKLVSELSLDEARDQLCWAIETLDALQDSMSEQDVLLEQWKDGR